MVDTAVPRPTFGPEGFVAPTEAAILAGEQADIDAAMGGGLNPALTTPQGQLASSNTAIIGDVYAAYTWLLSQFDPAYAEGRQQDAIGRIYFQERIAGAPTTVQATCFGLDGTTIPVGSLARAADGRFYVCQQEGVISSGSVDLPFSCAENGPIPLPGGSLNQIAQAVSGWESIVNSGEGALGRNVESRFEYEERRYSSVARNSVGQPSAVLSAVLDVPGVLDAYVRDNPTPAPVTFQGKTLGPNSVYACVLGGESYPVAEAIWSKKGLGCGYTGDTTVVVFDPNPAYEPPIPSYEVTFERPTVIPFSVLVSMQDNPGIPGDAQDQVRTAVIAAFAGADGGPRARIGSSVVAGRYYGPVLALGAWAQVIAVKIARLGSAGLVIGSITGDVLTVTSVTAGALHVGDILNGTFIQVGTSITQVISASGGVGTYRVAPVQTVASSGMWVSTPQDAVTMNIDEAPTVSSANIGLQLLE